MRWKRLEITILLTLVMLFTYAVAVSGRQAQTADGLLRLHVIANSDDPADQQVKLYVRDVLLKRCRPWLAGAQDAEEVRQILGAHLQELADTAASALRARGADDAVTVQLAAEYYPTRRYDTFSLPAGRYYGLKVKIGAAAGQNWWCVVFPPLCTDAAATAQTEALPAETSFQFRTAEWIGMVRNWLQEKG